jgi:hypothetical protein
MNKLKWRCIKWFTGLTSLYIDWRLTKPKRRRPLDIVLIDCLMALLMTKPELEAFSGKDLDSYNKAVSQAAYWHGTGRLHYAADNKLIDVFEKIIKEGGIQPFKDVFDIKQGNMTSISVARQRMYARIYADMHEYKGADLKKRFGSPRFWAYYFIMAINLHAIKEMGLWNPKALKKQQAEWRQQGEDIWTIKVIKRSGRPTGQFFNTGSDIKANYPIIIGIKNGKYKQLETAAYVAHYESRIGSTIPVSAFSHLEVPETKIEEVKRLLTKYGHSKLPVFAFESSERTQADKHFSELVRQKR